jgi:hypothetical protein
MSSKVYFIKGSIDEGEQAISDYKPYRCRGPVQTCHIAAVKCSINPRKKNGKLFITAVDLISSETKKACFHRPFINRWA